MSNTLGRPQTAEIAGLTLFAVGFGALIWLDAANGTLRDAVVTRTILWFLVAFAGYALLMVVHQRRDGGTDADAGTANHTRMTWWLLIALGLVARLVLLTTVPTLSDDVYRYLWEGHLVTEGVSPYAFSIDSPQGDAFAIEARDLANNTSLGSPYLPVAHVVFGAAAAVLPSEPWTMQIIMIAFDTVAMAMLVRLLALAGVPRNRALLYWLNPLVIVEVGHGAHLDAMILGLGLAGVYLTLKHESGASGFDSDTPRSWSAAAASGPLLVGFATLTRPLSLLYTPVLFWHWRWPQRLVYAATVGVPVAVAGAWVGLGFDDSGTGVFSSARAYTESFRFNSGIYQPFEQWVASQGLDDKGWNEPGALTRLIVFVVVAVALLAVFARARTVREPRSTLRLLAVPLMIYVLLTPVLHPWYVLLLLALVPVLAPGDDEPAARWVHAVPWLMLSGLLIFSYLTYEDPAMFAERVWVRRLTWWPTFAALAGAAAVTMKVRHGARADATMEVV